MALIGVWCCLCMTSRQYVCTTQHKQMIPVGTWINSRQQQHCLEFFFHFFSRHLLKTRISIFFSFSNRLSFPPLYLRHTNRPVYLSPSSSSVGFSFIHFSSVMSLYIFSLGLFYSLASPLQSCLTHTPKLHLNLYHIQLRRLNSNCTVLFLETDVCRYADQQSPQGLTILH